MCPTAAFSHVGILIFFCAFQRGKEMSYELLNVLEFSR